MECTHCHKNFKTVYSLTKHLKTAKFCLILQGKLEKKADDEIHTCEYCQKTLSTKYNLNVHVKTCSGGIKLIELQKQEQLDRLLNQVETHQIELQIQEEKYKIELEKRLKEQGEKHELELKEQEEKHELVLKEYDEKYKIILKEQEEKYEYRIKELNDNIKDICIKAVEKPSKISNVTNNNNVAFFNLSEEDIRDKCMRFGPERCKSVKDIANYTVENILTNDNGQLMYNCSDASRQIFKFVDGTGNTIKDPNATKLISQIRPIFNEKCASLKDKIAYHREDKERDLSKTRNLNSKNYIRKELEECKDYEDKLGILECNIKLMDKNQEFCKELIKRTC